MITTTWNAIATAVQSLPGNWDGLEPVEEDFPVVLRALEDVPGYLEVTTPDGGTILYLPEGRGSGSLSDWVPADHWPAGAHDREGIAVSADILRELDIPPCDHPCMNGFNHRRAPTSLTVDEIRYIVQPTDTFRATVSPDWWIEWEDGPHHGAVCILCGAQSGTPLWVPDCEDAEIRGILMRMVTEGWGSEDDLKERIFVRIKHSFRDVLFHCPVCGWHLQTEAGTWNIGCQHYEIQYPGGLVGYHPQEGTDWEEAGLFKELAVSRQEGGGS